MSNHAGYKTLGELRDYVNKLINEQGESSDCVSYIYTRTEALDCMDEENHGKIDDGILKEVFKQVGKVYCIEEEIDKCISAWIDKLI